MFTKVKLLCKLILSTGHSAEDMKLQYETLNKAYTLLENISFTDRQATDLMEKLNKVKSKVSSEELKNEMTDFI